MKKRDKIIYWIATLWASLGLVSTGLVQVFNLKNKPGFMVHLAYPDYFLTIIGVWKILGVVALLVPKLPLLKEWAYAGLFFLMTGAVFSHLAVRDGIAEMFPSLLLLTLIFVSWYFRPADRKIHSLTTQMA
ncbi:MAG TPA: DoxX family protein [Puia sp.]|jgi:hypothetical protein|nr:DoxX family protein [Puia sp.]